MTAFTVGKQIFDNRIEYPLPKKRGARDYVFYFVPTGKGYGKGAKKFFDRFYPNHRAKQANSLQAVVNFLHGEIEKRGVTHVREVVLVAHANPVDLHIPVLDDVSDAQRRPYKFTNAASLATLQKDFKAGKFSTFARQRRKVIAHLTEESWVTLRACNFGQSKEGLYALYAFFGGRANVYSPEVVQFFGIHPIMSGMRLETKLEVHEHLTKQRFLPKDVHTPDRQDVVVRFLADPGQFSETIELMSANFDKDTPQVKDFQDVVRKLNAGRLPQKLKAGLDSHGLPLTGKQRVRVRVRDARWLVRDRVEHENLKQAIEYHLFVQSSLPNTDSLLVEATLPDAYSTRESFPIQLFFQDSENHLWHGRLFTLASFTGQAKEKPAKKKQYTALLKILDSGQVSGALLTRFADEGIDIAPNTRVAVHSQRTINGNPRKSWLVHSDDKYLIKQQYAFASHGALADALVVYEQRGVAARLKEELKMMSYLGKDPDMPGTELMAYLDRFSFDELKDFIDYLRAPYRPSNVIYLHHAMEALKRKQGFLKWWSELPETKEAAKSNDPLPFNPYTDLSYHEAEDRSFAFYSFEPNLYWAEVKASNPPRKAFKDDLFAEQVLKHPTDGVEAGLLDPDSITADPATLRALEISGVERFVEIEKFTIEDPVDSASQLSCEQFAQLLAMLSGLKGKSAEEIEEVLNSTPLIDSIPLFKFKVIPKHFLYALNFMNVIKGTGGIPETVLKHLIDRIPALGLGSFRLTPISIHVLRAYSVIGLVLFVAEMYANFLIEQSNALALWEQTGKVVGIKQWARRLKALTHQRQDDFPETIQIDLVDYAARLRKRFPLTPHLQNPYHLALYHEEQYEQSGVVSTVFFAPERIKKGFDAGVKLIEKEAHEMLAKSQDIITDALRDAGLDSCMIQELRKAGFLEPGQVRALVMREYAQSVLEKMPNI